MTDTHAVLDPVFPSYPYLHAMLDREDADLPSPLFTVVTHTGQIEDHKLSEMRAAALSWAATLSTRIEPGDRVVMTMPTSMDFLSAFFGILWAGGVAVPMPYAFHRQAEYLENYLSSRVGVIADCGAKVIVTHPDQREVSEMLASRCQQLDHVITVEDLAESNSVAPYPATADTLALLQYTSGSTGDPKGVMLTHGTLLNNLRAIGECVQPCEVDRVVSWLPMYHDMGLIGGWLFPLGTGLRHAVMATEVFLAEPTFWLQAMTTTKATITVSPNFGYALAVKRIKDAMLPMFDLSAMRTMLCGAEPIDATVMAAFQDKFAASGLRPNAILPVYGLAEVTLAATFTEIYQPIKTKLIDRKRLETEGLAVEVDDTENNNVRVVCVGRPVGDGVVSIIGQDDQPLADFQEGQVLVRSNSVMKGYYNREEANAQALKNGWLHTGDLGFLDNGELYITGRLKDLIITYGRNFYPHDIEWLAAEVKGVRVGCVAAFGIPNKEAATEEIVVIAETRVTEKTELQRIRRETRKLLISAIECNPKQIVLVPPRTVPKTTSGKIKRIEARRLYLAKEIKGL